MFSSLFYRQARIAVELRAPVKLRYTSTAAFTQDFKDRAPPVAQPFSAIPGPRPLPVIRNALQFKKNVKKLHIYLDECFDKYGEIFKLEAPGI